MRGAILAVAVIGLVPGAFVALVSAHGGHDHSASSQDQTPDTSRVVVQPGIPSASESAGATFANLAQSVEWSQYRRNAARTGFSSDTGLVAPDLRWVVKEKSEIVASPLIVRDAVLVATVDGAVSLRELSDGKVRWRNDVGGLIVATPAADANRVYVPDSTGTVHALFLSNGSHVWRAEVGGSIVASPALVGNSLVVANTSGGVVSLDVSTGAPRWSRTVPGAIVASPAIANDRLVIAASGSGRLLVLDPDDGSTRATVITSRRVTATPVLWGNLLVLADGEGFVSVVDLAVGHERWFVDTGQARLVAPAVGDGRVIVPSAALSGLAAFRLEGGTLAWTLIDSRLARFDAPPALGNGVVYAPTRDGRLLAVSAFNGTIRWELPIGSVVASPALAGDAVVLAVRDGRIVAIGPSKLEETSRAPVDSSGPNAAQLPWWLPVPLSVFLVVIALRLARRKRRHERVSSVPMEWERSRSSSRATVPAFRRVVCPYCACRIAALTPLSEGNTVRCPSCARIATARRVALRHP